MNGDLPREAKKFCAGEIADSANDEKRDGDFAAGFSRAWHVTFHKQRQNEKRAEKRATDHPRQGNAQRNCDASDHGGIQIEISARFDERGEGKSESKDERDAVTRAAETHERVRGEGENQQTAEKRQKNVLNRLEGKTRGAQPSEEYDRGSSAHKDEDP